MKQSGHDESIVIYTSGLIKDYGDFRALDGLDLTVRKGEVHGFLGPNGSGKSTTIRVLLGILRKTGGEARLLDGDPWDDAVALHQRIAYVPGDVNLWPNLTGGEAIDLFCRLRGGIDQQRRKEMLHRFELDPTKKCGAYSKGNRQKVAIVAALASDAEVFILDEPTSGLDPLMEVAFQSCIKELKASGKTVFLSSHILAEAEALCDRVTIIRSGKAVTSGTLGELRRLMHMTMSVVTETPPKGLGKIPGVHAVRTKGSLTEFELEERAVGRVLQALQPHGIQRLVSVPPSLEKLFLRQYDDRPAMPTRVKEGH